MLTPVHMMPEQTVLFSCKEDQSMHGDVLVETSTVHGYVHVAIQDLYDANHVMTSRYVAKWKWVDEGGVRKQIIRTRLVLGGFMEW